ncbi:ArnT family glycosyltransferase [Maritalea sp.]|uniref:ArnT family glycosyltransferase n=1 Tax=Maritalea sp. TaxID=2003361 RepID=UPI003EF248A7
MSEFETQLRHRLSASSGQIRTAVIWLIILTTLYRVWGAWSIDLVIGEAYYLSSARQLHLGYFDQPPIFIWIIWLTKTLTGSEAPVILRLPFILTFSAATWMFYRIGARLHSERAGLFTAIIANIPILFTLSIGSWMQPEAPLTLTWLVVVWLLMDIFFGPQKRTPLRSWILVGIWVGLTFMTKYHAVFLIYGAGLFILFNKDARKWLLHPGPYLAVLIAAIISLPVLIWNMQNDMASFVFQGSRAFGEAFHLDWLLRMIGGQLIYITPWIALPALWVGLRTLFKGPTGIYPAGTPNGMSFFFLMLAHGPILFFTAVAAWSNAQFHFHWQAPGYMMLFPILGAAAAIAFDKVRIVVIAWLVIGALLSTLVMSVLITHTVTGWARDYFPPGEDPTSGALQWQELDQYFETEGVYDAQNTFVAGFFWIECGQIDNVVRGRKPIACLADDPRNIAFNIDLLDHAGSDAYIAAVWHSDETIIGTLSNVFEKIERVGDVQIMRNGFAAMPPVRIFKAKNLLTNREILSIGSPTVELTALPRTQMSKLSGTIERDPASTQETVDLWLDDTLVGTISLSGWKQEFEFVPERNWAVGLRKSQIRLESKSGVQIRFENLSVEFSD